MADLAEDRVITEIKGLPGRRKHFGIAAGVKAYLNVLALIDAAGLYNPDERAYCAGLIVDFPTGGNRGDNSAGLDDAETVIVESGIRVPFDLSPSGTPTNADIGKPVFAVDNHTVSLQPYNALVARPFVGYFAGVDGEQGWVDLVDTRTPGLEAMGAYRVAPATAMAADDVFVFNAFQDVYPVAGDGGAVILTEDLPDATPGQEITILGNHATNTVRINSGLNTQLAGGAHAILGDGDALTLVGDADGVWVEKSRSINNAA